MQNLLILGAGQYGLVVCEIAESLHCYESIDFLDDKNPVAIGRLQDYEKFIEIYDSAIVAIGNSDMRLDYIEKLKMVGYKIATLIHQTAYVSPSCKLGEGCVVEPLAGLHANTVVETGCLISMGVLVNHNAVIKIGCHIDCGSVVAARAVVPAKTKVLANTLFPEI